MPHGVWVAVTALLPDEDGTFFVWDAGAREYYCAAWSGGHWTSHHAAVLRATHWMRVYPPEG